MGDNDKYPTDFNFELFYDPSEIPDDELEDEQSDYSPEVAPKDKRMYVDKDFMITYYLYLYHEDYCTLEPIGIEPDKEESFLFSSDSADDINISIEMMSDSSVSFEFDVLDESIPIKEYCYYREEDNKSYEDKYEEFFFSYPSEEVVPGKETLGEYDFINSNFDRKFGNNDFMIYWHGGKILNLQYVSKIEISNESDVTDKTVSTSRYNDDSYSSNQLSELSVKFKLGDIWYRDNDDGMYRYKNRDSVLKMLYDIYNKNIVVSIGCDLKIMKYSVMTELNVKQTKESDNTYIADCTFTGIDILQKLPKTAIIKNKHGDYEEVSNVDVTTEIPLTMADWSTENEQSCWDKFVDYMKYDGVIEELQDEYN